ncbi:hypothetical protein BS50DRAFT_579120 [Corynespora cassiicola Philippines]|uniref:AB hydrolase-1 domain-containing protein n=1 Tax=Corynespora cassiicola Philippines TaxID=1448308 RepID=A0A2T2N574_CORCC|nr:hypothetical protein BS50DRAFT_579120 [Corynespora cassiicola Philippines]
MSPNPKFHHPSILIAHGSYHTPATLSPLLTALQLKNLPTHCPQLPTADPKHLIPADYRHLSLTQYLAERDSPPEEPYPAQTADAAVLEAVLRESVEGKGEEVLVVAHSSGGWSATEAVVPELQRDVRRRGGKEGGVVGVFYISAFLVEKGESVWGYFGGLPEEEKGEADWVVFHVSHLTPGCYGCGGGGGNAGTDNVGGQKSGLATANRASEYFFHDMPAEEAERLAKELTACPFLTSPLTNDPYPVLPMAYLVCELDRILPPTIQRSMIKETEQRSGRKIEVLTCAASHEVLVSKPELVADFVAEFAEKCCRE